MLGASGLCLASLCDPGQSWPSLVLILHLVRDWTWVSGSHPTHPDFAIMREPSPPCTHRDPASQGWLVLTSFVGMASEFIHCFSFFFFAKLQI